MPPRIRVLYSSLAVVLFFIAAVPLYRDLSRPTDIWWTPRTMLVPLTASQDRVEIYARGRPLRTLLDAGQLRIADETGSSVLAASEVGLRFNNWDRVRSERLPLLLAYSAGCGAMAMLFLLVVTGRLAYRGDKERVAGSDATAR